MNTRRAHDRVELHCGDMLAVLPSLSADSIDACVTDPPYHLQSIHKRFAAKGRDETSERYAAGPYGRHATGFMGKQWDGGGVAFDPATWAEVYRVLKPGAHLLAFGGTRTSHRMACAIEDAGFEIRDTILWLYGSGFPKSHDVSNGIDRAAGVERQVIGPNRYDARRSGTDLGRMNDDGWEPSQRIDTAPATDAARQWQGWGTALKPACEPIILARKPLSEDTIAANVLKWGTGAINIDGCRIAGEARAFGNGTARSAGIMGESKPRGRWESPSVQRRKGAINHLSDRPAQETEAEGRMMSRQSAEAYRAERPGEELGRWPANIILSYPEDEYALRRDVTEEQKSELYRWLSENL